MTTYIDPIQYRRFLNKEQQFAEQVPRPKRVQYGQSARFPQAVRQVNKPMRNQGRSVVRSNRDMYIQVEKLKIIAAEQAQVIAEQKEQLQIKSDAIQQQTKDIKKLDAELVWTRAALQQAEQELEAAAQEDNWQEKYARLQAETDNLRKRLDNRATEKVREERNRILSDMLPLADHLEMALQHSDAQAPVQPEPETKNNEANQDTSIDTAFVDNIRATQSAFLGTLQRYDVEPIQAHGEPFDPTIHEAVGQTDQTSVPDDHVAEVLQTGYRDGERLLRPARVIVSKK